jgi:Na+-translocating ferredoxin:NAD+ oxidoreductase RnfG subunit
MDLEALVISTLITICGALLGLILVFVKNGIKKAKEDFKKAKVDFLNKIDEYINSYATMLNSELQDIKEKTKENAKDIGELKQRFDEFKNEN